MAGFWARLVTIEYDRRFGTRLIDESKRNRKVCVSSGEIANFYDRICAKVNMLGSHATSQPSSNGRRVTSRTGELSQPYPNSPLLRCLYLSRQSDSQKRPEELTNFLHGINLYRRCMLNILNVRDLLQGEIWLWTGLSYASARLFALALFPRQNFEIS